MSATFFSSSAELSPRLFVDMIQVVLLAALAATALASYGANINYRSPSLHHPGMGISIRKVVKRNDPRSTHSPSNLNFTHGVASGDPCPNSVILWTRCACSPLRGITINFPCATRTSAAPLAEPRRLLHLTTT